MSRSSLPPVSKSTFRIEAQGPPPNVEICHLATQFGSVIVVDASLARGRTGGKEEVPARGGVTSAILEVSQRLASAPLGADEKRQKARAKETTCRRQAGAGLRIKTRQDLGGNQIGPDGRREREENSVSSSADAFRARFGRMLMSPPGHASCHPSTNGKNWPQIWDSFRHFSEFARDCHLVFLIP